MERGDMKVLYARTNYWFNRRHGGAVGHVIGVLNALGKRAQVHVISNERLYGVHKIPCTVVKPIGLGWWGEVLYSARFAKHLKRAIRMLEPDFVYHRHTGYSFAIAQVCRSTQTPLILEFNGSWLSKAKPPRGLKTRLSVSLANWVASLVEPYNLRNALLIVVVSDALRELLLARGLPEAKIIVCPNGVDPARFSGEDAATQGAIRRELGIPPDKTVVGFAGTFSSWRGTPELAEAIHLVNENPSWQNRVFFVLYGGESEGRLTMERSIDHFDNVRFAGGIEYDRIGDYLSVCDVLVSPYSGTPHGTTFFGSPTKLFEYMCLAKGIVATRIGQNGDFLEHMNTAYLCPPGDGDALAKGITHFLEDPREVARMGSNARQVVLRSHTWDHNIARMLEVFAQVTDVAQHGG